MTKELSFLINILVFRKVFAHRDVGSIYFMSTVYAACYF